MRITVDQFKSIRNFDDNLYHQLLGVTRGIGNNTVEIDLSHPLVGEAFQKSFAEWKTANNIAEAPPPPPHNDKCSCTDCFNKRVAEQQRSEKARLEVEKQNAPGRARLAHWIVNEGLIDNQFNKDAFLRFLDEKFPGLTVIRPDHVDAFVASKRMELQWAAPTPAPASAPVQSEPVLLSDGSPQLPIDTEPIGPHLLKYTVIQLRDLSARQRARAAGEGELQPLEYVRGGKIISEPRIPLSMKPGVQHSPKQIEDWNVRIAQAHARQTGSHGSGGSSWFDSRRL